MAKTRQTTEALLERIAALEALNRELLREKEQQTRLEFAWTGNLGHWYWDVRTNAVTFNPLKVTTLGYDMSEVPSPVPYQFFTDKLHPEDLPVAMKAMADHLQGSSDVYEVEYRIRARDGSWRWYYDRGRITLRDVAGKPLFLAGIVFDITDTKERMVTLEKDNRMLAEISARDGLTGLLNHRTLMERLNALCRAGTGMQEPLSVAMIDIDDFKRVNDTKGHVYGDRVLAEVAEIIRSGIRDTDVAGRYGGEEFLVAFPGTDAAKAYLTAERMRQAVAAHDREDGLRVTVSIGVCQHGGESVAALVQRADERMYQAKREGKNRVC